MGLFGKNIFYVKTVGNTFCATFSPNWPTFVLKSSHAADLQHPIRVVYLILQRAIRRYRNAINGSRPFISLIRLNR